MSLQELSFHKGRLDPFYMAVALFFMPCSTRSTVLESIYLFTEMPFIYIDGNMVLNNIGFGSLRSGSEFGFRIP